MEGRRPVPPLGIVNAPERHDTSRPQHLDASRSGINIERDPAFIAPFSGVFDAAAVSGRYGFSGWTSPNAPIGPSFTETNGWFSLGFSLTWDAKPHRAAIATP